MDEYVHDEMKISTVEIQSLYFGGLESRAEIVYQDREEEQEDAAGNEKVVTEDKGIVNAVAVLEDSKKEIVDDFVLSKSTWVPPIRRTDSSENNLMAPENLSPMEKPLVSSRFGHRKFVKASPEGIVYYIFHHSFYHAKKLFLFGYIFQPDFTTRAVSIF